MNRASFSLIALTLLIACGAKPGENSYWKIDPVKFGVESIAEGYDSLQIRIWDLPPLGLIEVPALTISCTNGVWSAKIDRIQFTFIDDTLRLGQTLNVPYKILSNDLRPHSSWKKAIGKLDSLGLFTLPDCNKIMTREELMILDGRTYVVEIATHDSYRTYSYYMPEHFGKKYWQAKNMLNILEVIDQEFGIPLYWDYDDRGKRRYGVWEELNRTPDSTLIESAPAQK